MGSVSMEFRSQGLSSILWGVTKLLQYTEGWDLPFSTRESGGGLAVEAGYSYSWGGGVSTRWATSPASNRNF